MILNILQDPTSLKSDAQLLHELFSVAQNCFHRMQELAQYITKQSHFSDSSDNEGDYLQFASQPSSRRASKECPLNKMIGRIQNLPICSAASDGSQKLPASPNKPLAKTVEASRPTSYPTASPDFNLSILRKAHESELVAKEREKAQRILRARANALVRNEEYVTDLLKRRQNLLATFNEKISEVFSSIAAQAIVIKSSIDMDNRKKIIKTLVAEMSQKDQDLMVLTPLVEMLAVQTNTLSLLVREFMNRCRQQLIMASQQADPTMLVNKVLDEINIVEHHIVELIIQNFDDLKDPSMKASVRISVQNYLFTTALSPAIQSLLSKSSSLREGDLSTCFINCSWQELFEKLGICGKLQLPRDKNLDAFPIRDAGIYGRAIEDLRCISAHLTPYEKLGCLMKCCNSICQAVEDYNRESITITENERFITTDDASLGSEELLLLCAYVIVRAHVPNLPSQLQFINKLIPEELVRGEAGYVLATMQTSLDYAISRLSFDSQI